MTTATAIAEAVQADLRTLSRFNDQSIRINDWNMLDDSIHNAPWIIIETPGLISCDFNDPSCAVLNWQLRIILVRPFLGKWDETRPLLETDRTQVLTHYTIGDNRNIVSGAYTDLKTIRDENPNEPTAPGWRKTQNPAIDLPAWIALPMILEVEERR